MEAVAGPSIHERVADERVTVFPRVALPGAPAVGVLWRRVFVLAYVLLGLFFLDRISSLLYNYWMFESLGFEDVFWTNFWTGAALFVVTLVAFTALSAAPAFLHDVGAGGRRIVLAIVVFDELIAAYLMSQNYHTFLGFFNGKSFGVDDPVFGHDIGFYVFDLPAWWAVLRALEWMFVLGLIASVYCAYAAYRRSNVRSDLNWFLRGLGAIATPYTLMVLGALGILGAIDFWLRRYNLLVKNNEDSHIFTGAEALDVTGFFSTRNDYLLTALVELGIVGAIIFALYTLRKALPAGSTVAWRRPVQRAALVVVALLALDFAFKAGVTLRDEISIQPDEPVVQMEYLQRHVDATLAAYGLDEAEIVPFVPKGAGDPLPNPDEMLQSATLRNAPLWPGFVSELENVLDPQHVERVELTALDENPFVVYGPTIDAFRQEESLRPYYDFLDIDTVRYTIGGEPRLFASAVRELPVDPFAPKPWLMHWAQQHVLYTNGYGLVMTPLNGVDPDGDPAYASSGIPTQVTAPELQVANEAVYFGEGMETAAFTNVEDLAALDRPTDEGVARVETVPNIETGVEVDSLLKRLVVGWEGGFTWRVVFNDLINDDSRVHYFRGPIERPERIAPFLYLDTDAYAVAADGRIVWMINGMTTTDRYPYSRIGDLGDKADVRSPIERPHRWVNYVEDSVKITVDATTGAVQFYKVSDDPIVETWADIYPDLFVDGEEMPPAIREQVQYSPRWFHLQVDDIYWQYHMGEALNFFQAEDIWDDGDEVLGPILQEGEALSFSIEPYHWMVDTGGVLPASPTGAQFAMSMVFTPEAALNLRALATIYMTGEDYGRFVVLQVPKGVFAPGPEQADAAIDQQPGISEQIALWNRRGNEVIRGHTTALVVQDELIYVEPIFIRSKQNPLPQLKRVVVVFRGHAAMGTTLDEALRKAIDEVGRGLGPVTSGAGS